MVCTFHSSLDMHDAAHTIMISDIATSAWLIDFCHKAIDEYFMISHCQGNAKLEYNGGFRAQLGIFAGTRSVK